MNISLTLIAFALALLVPNLVEAEGNDGRIEFSGTVVEPTCRTISQSIAVPPGPSGTSIQIGHCLSGPASANQQEVLYASATRALHADESDQLLRYLVERTTVAGIAAKDRLQTVTYL